MVSAGAVVCLGAECIPPSCGWRADGDRMPVLRRLLFDLILPPRALRWGVLTWSWPRRLFIQRRIVVFPSSSDEVGVTDVQEAAWHAALQPYRGFLPQ